jgi:hypothetical protein
MAAIRRCRSASSTGIWKDSSSPQKGLTRQEDSTRPPILFTWAIAVLGPGASSVSPPGSSTDAVSIILGEYSMRELEAFWGGVLTVGGVSSSISPPSSVYGEITKGLL